MRRYNEPVEVRTAPGRPWSAPGTVEFDHSGFDDTGPAGRPEAFVWRGRLYVVREVLGHWRERRAWWREALDPFHGQPHGIAAAARERQVWRVEASAGRLAGRGVFDLACDNPDQPLDLDVDRLGAAGDVPGAAGDVSGAAGWQLMRVAD